jgi:hypothetical protein
VKSPDIRTSPEGDDHCASGGHGAYRPRKTHHQQAYNIRDPSAVSAQQTAQVRFNPGVARNPSAAVRSA